MKIDASLISSFAPTGRLRASINLGNPILANRDPESGQPQGVSVDLARAFADRLGVALELVVFDTAGNSVDAVRNEIADIGFFAIDPLRSQEIFFTSPYVLIEGCYLVRKESRIQSNEEVDQPELRVAVGAGSAYDLFLSRAIKQAQLVRAASSPAVVDTFLSQGLDVAAGVKQQLEADAQRITGLRLLPGRFMIIRQAMGTPRGRGQGTGEYLQAFIQDMKASGFVAGSLEKHGIQGAEVAPLQD